jgi:tripartite-type tricarboxylate transporter receptor subunit TctC
MNLTIKTFAGCLAALLLLSLAPAFAQTYPDKPIRILVGFAAGGPADISARLIADRLAEAWGQPMVVENVTGAAGNLATDRVAKAAPDGYTLLLAASATIVTNPSLYQKLPFDPVKDLSPVTQICFTPNILAVPSDVPASSVPELVAFVRAHPGALTYGSAGVGTSQHLAGELFKTMAGIDIQHVPYRGIAAVMPDLLGGRLTMAFGNISAILPLVREGKLRALAVSSRHRSPAVPDLPTMIEAGFADFDSTAWFALMARAGTPSAIIEKLHREVVRVLALPDVRKRFDDLGMEVVANTPAEFAAVIKDETPFWAKVIREAGIKAGE